jgi:ectoine hydroxylase
MTPEQILAIPPRVLTQSQREFYFQEGYLLLERIVGDEWIR